MALAAKYCWDFLYRVRINDCSANVRRAVYSVTQIHLKRKGRKKGRVQVLKWAAYRGNTSALDDHRFQMVISMV